MGPCSSDSKKRIGRPETLTPEDIVGEGGANKVHDESLHESEVMISESALSQYRLIKIQMQVSIQGLGPKPRPIRAVERVVASCILACSNGRGGESQNNC